MAERCLGSKPLHRLCRLSMNCPSTQAIINVESVPLSARKLHDVCAARTSCWQTLSYLYDSFKLGWGRSTREVASSFGKD
jgi:hypothetical protein